MMEFSNMDEKDDPEAIRREITRLSSEAASQVADRLRTGKPSDKREALDWAAREIGLAYRRIRDLEQRVDVLESEPIELKHSLGVAIQRRRQECGRTQADLAEDMNRLGFTTWKRLTVAEVESGRRRASWEELLGLAVLFEVPVAQLLTAGLGRAAGGSGRRMWQQPVVVNERLAIFGDYVSDLLTGGDGYGNLEQAARHAAQVEDDEDDWRPAAAARAQARGLTALIPAAEAHERDRDR